MAAGDLHRMKMFGRMMSCCVALLLTFSSVSAVGRALNSITDLRSVGFGQSVPEQSLRLLHWFANEIDIDINGDISLTFDPTGYDYGSHRYRNDEQLLDPLPRGYQYYSLGNIHRQGSLRLPQHVIQSEHEDGNRARIVIRVREQNVGRRTSQIIDRVYITQHYETSEHRGTAYDPEHTYEITTNLLRAIRKFSINNDNINLLMSLRDHFRSSANDSQLLEMRNTWGQLACVGLLLFIVIPEKYSSHEHNNRRQPAPRSNTQSDAVVNITESNQNNTNLNFTSQDNNTCVCSVICVVIIVVILLLIVGLLYWAFKH
ncbi:uncharacterized protein LOC113020898 [Astatotilapia calliptera]|uniref:Immunoglobulin V-set domain-containing protein n=2 Tax=Astatotilapia calliptera TaxID=8154 RepID=A0AAX7VNT2_ASTCA|nr:uncharacterized protein LOC113020898 [Astatotilapia calliptera]